MRLIDPYADIPTYKKIVKQYGGEYSLLETLMLHGVGSPKVEYISGIPEFDIIHNLEKLERSVINFELLKSGLIIRINKRQRLAVAIEHFDQLESIRLIGRPIMVNGRELREGILYIDFRDQETLVFNVRVQVFAGVGKYFSKKPFLKYFRLE